MIRRHKLTIDFISKLVSKSKTILDLGVENELSNYLHKSGYKITNTDFDLDKHPECLNRFNMDVVTGFEILEHLIEPA